MLEAKRPPPSSNPNATTTHLPHPILRPLHHPTPGLGRVASGGHVHSRLQPLPGRTEGPSKEQGGLSGCVLVIVVIVIVDVSVLVALDYLFWIGILVPHGVDIRECA